MIRFKYLFELEQLLFDLERFKKIKFRGIKNGDFLAKIHRLDKKRRGLMTPSSYLTSEKLLQQPTLSRIAGKYDTRGCFLWKRKGGQEQTRENQAKNDGLTPPAELDACRCIIRS